MFSTLYGTCFSFYMNFKMMSAICFNLDQSKILSSGNNIIISWGQGLNNNHWTIFYLPLQHNKISKWYNSKHFHEPNLMWFIWCELSLNKKSSGKQRKWQVSPFYFFFQKVFQGKSSKNELFGKKLDSSMRESIQRRKPHYKWTKCPSKHLH